MTYGFLPEGLKIGLDLYLNHGIRPGSFLNAVLCNDLKGALGSADENNRKLIFEIVQYFHNFIPSLAWGSSENVDAWIKMIRDIKKEENKSE